MKMPALRQRPRLSPPGWRRMETARNLSSGLPRRQASYRIARRNLGLVEHSVSEFLLAPRKERSAPHSAASQASGRGLGAGGEWSPAPAAHRCRIEAELGDGGSHKARTRSDAGSTSGMMVGRDLVHRGSCWRERACRETPMLLFSPKR
jgi:hypothetical protein